MTEEMEITNSAPQTTDAGVDNGAALDPRTTTGNEKLDATNARILELQQSLEADKKELRELTEEREKLAAGQVWTAKIDDMNEAEVAALQEALAKRQSVGVNGIKSSEGVNGQIREVDE